MKKSELYSQIQTEIKSILSEESAEDIENKTSAQAELNKELEKTKELTTESSNPEVSKDFDPNDLDGDDIDDDRLRQRVQRLRHTGSNFDDLNESSNPEVSRAVDRFITAMADRYDYSMQDAVYAIMAVLKQRNYDGLNEEEGMDDDEMDKKASKGAKKGDSVTTIANKLGETASEMKRVVNKWKKMEDGSEKEKLKGRLKSLSKIKKELEGLL